MGDTARRDLKILYGKLHSEISAILFRVDPMNINGGVNTDEYDIEVDGILPALVEAKSVHDVRKIIHEEFVIWFGDNIAGPENRYTQVALEIWKIWLGRLDKKAKLDLEYEGL